MLDYSLYPELDEQDWPAELHTTADRADYIHRVCSHWDFYGVCPDADTRALLSGWREAFEEFPLPGSPAYGALTEVFAFRSGGSAPYPDVLPWERQDQADGRDLEAELRLT